MIKKEVRCSSAYKFHVRCTVVLFHWAMQSHATRTQMLRYSYRSETIMTARRMASLVHPTSNPPESRKFHFARPTKKRPTVFLHIAAQVMVHMHTSTEQVLQQAF